MKYKTPQSILAMTTTRQNGYSVNHYASNNLSFTVNENPEIVLKNRHKLANEIGIPLSQWVFARQCHSDQIKKVTLQDAGKGATSHQEGIPNVDALYTYEKNLVLSFFHADCVPILFYDETVGLIGAIHAGWQGTLKEITKKSLSTVITTEGLDPKNLKVHLGPALSFESSLIDKELIMLPYELSEHIVATKDNQIKINTLALNIEQCLSLGIKKENIVNCGIDTFSNPETYYSFQRDHDTGRHLSLIVLV